MNSQFGVSIVLASIWDFYFSFWGREGWRTSPSVTRELESHCLWFLNNCVRWSNASSQGYGVAETWKCQNDHSGSAGHQRNTRIILAVLKGHCWNKLETYAMPFMESGCHSWLLIPVLSWFPSVPINLSFNNCFPTEIHLTGNDTLKCLMTCTDANDRAKTHSCLDSARSLFFPELSESLLPGSHSRHGIVYVKDCIRNVISLIGDSSTIFW